MDNKKNRIIDSLLPDEMAIKAEEIGVRKALMLSTPLFALSILAGAFIAFGAMLSTTVVAGAGGIIPYGVSRLLSGFVFSLGLILVVVGGAELFTGNNLIVMAWASQRVTTFQLLRNWTIVYLGNFAGALGAAFIVFASGQYMFGNAAVAASALSTADGKMHHSFFEALFLGVLCNTLVCLAVWMSFSARTTTDKVFAVVPPVTAFVACGFEHSVANMYFVPLAILIKNFAPDSIWQQLGKTPADFDALTTGRFFLSNLVPVTIGNIIGGAILVGIVYWFVYLHPRRQKA